MPEYSCEWALDRFSADAAYTGENRMVRVRGEGDCPRAGYSVELVADNPGIAPPPQRLAVRIVESSAAAGADVMTPVVIDQLLDVSPAVTEIAIRGLGVIEVQEPA